MATLGDQDLGKNPGNISAGVTSQCCSMWAPGDSSRHTALAPAGIHPVTLMPHWLEAHPGD